MNTYLKIKTIWTDVLFALVMTIPSLGLIQKYFGNISVLLYGIVNISIAMIIRKYLFVILKLTNRRVFWLSAITFVILIVCFLVIYPIANSKTPGSGSDRDEGLNITATELLHGRYPYYTKTYLEGPITPMPGSIILAIPFVLLGNSAYQNIFWLAVFFIVMGLYLKDMRKSLLMLWIILLLCPVVLYEVVTGGDLLSNSLYVLIFALLLISSVNRENTHLWKKILSAILLGIVLSSRTNFMLILPLTFSILLRHVGLKSAIKYCSLTLLTLVMITLPFYLYDPTNFSPLHTASKLGQFQSILPFAGILIPALTAMLILTFCFKKMDAAKYFKNCAIAQAVPVLSLLILHSIASGKLSLLYGGYGIFFLLFGTLSYFIKLHENIDVITPERSYLEILE